MEPTTTAQVELVQRLLARADDIAQSLADEVAASVPPRWREHVDGECRPLTHVMIREAIASLATGSGMTRSSLLAVRDSAATYDPVGVPAAVTMRAMRAALTSFVGTVRTEAQAMGRPRADSIAAIATLTARAPMVVFEIMTAFVSGYGSRRGSAHGPAHDPRLDAVMEGLHPTALEVLRLTADGLTTRQIASRLGCTPSNVSYHLAELRRRFDAPNRAALVAKAAHVLGDGGWVPEADAS